MEKAYQTKNTIPEKFKKVFELSISGHVDLAKDQLISILKTEEITVFGIVWLFRLFLIMHYSVKDLNQWFEMVKELDLENETRSRSSETELALKLIDMMSLWAKEDITSAIAQLDELIGRPNFRDQPSFLWILALKHLFKRAGEKDLTLIDELLELDPDNEYFYFIHAAVSSSNKQYDKALKSFEKSLQINPLYIDSLISQASTLAVLDRREEAMQCFERIARIESNDYKFLINKSKLLIKLQLYDDLLPLYDKIIELRPNVAQTYISKAQVFTKLEQFQEAMDILNAGSKVVAEKNVKESEGILLFQANLSFRLESYDNALSYYDQALGINPKNYNAWILKGTVYEYLEDHLKAIECYDKAVESDEKLTQGYVSKGNALLSLKKAEEALELFDKALEIDPKCQEALVSKGAYFYEIKENPRMALVYLNKALDLDPHDNIPLLTKAHIYNEMGMYQEAIEIFDIALKSDPNDYDTLHQRHLARKAIITGEDKECQ